MAITSDQRYYLKLKALYYLYEKEYTHTETAKLLGISRVTLNKLLDEARSEGMLKLEIVDTKNLKHILMLEDRLKERFGLQDVKLIDTPAPDADFIARLAAEAAKYVELFIRSNMKVGIAWGRTLRAMLGYLSPNPAVSGLEIYTLLGGASSEADFQPNLMAQTFISLYSGTSYIINAPYICHSELLCSEIRKEPSIVHIMEASKHLDLALVGIGESPDALHFRHGYYHFSDALIDELLGAGAVGDICGNFYDAHGSVCQTSISGKIVSIDLNSLKTCKKVIGVAGGPGKALAVLGALNGGYVDVLVTDANTAEQVLSLS
jgi:deoxyribonucleoside regulator